jgi:hypothetical protein
MGDVDLRRVDVEIIVLVRLDSVNAEWLALPPESDASANL